MLHPLAKTRSPSVTSLKGSKHAKSDSRLSLLDDDDICSTCLDGFSEVNPAVTLKCGHRFHLQCIYAWLERSETCPLCGAQTSFDEIL
ncbi:hypothetical protein QBZ16_002863 [Prototheca wickerhamii]|uniref:RING-type E3 ubiquitin transferase n=1 Tax=Prototheca wickerhamii TaxID=3111 RepID=A0AAD9MJ12_PROWI|nr:hypothetical protein QBZ16_002863 [Prototheca wickerhamii]